MIDPHRIQRVEQVPIGPTIIQPVIQPYSYVPSQTVKRIEDPDQETQEIIQVNVKIYLTFIF